jgi:hypothetical protein
MVFPDDLHESMIHSYWIDTWERVGDFLKRFVWERRSAATSPSSRDGGAAPQRR